MVLEFSYRLNSLKGSSDTLILLSISKSDILIFSELFIAFFMFKPVLGL